MSAAVALLVLFGTLNHNVEEMFTNLFLSFWHHGLCTYFKPIQDCELTACWTCVM